MVNNMKNPFLSLCMIVRDAEDTIEALLKSVFEDRVNSGQPNIDEIIIVDTGSEDRTRELICKYLSSEFTTPVKWDLTPPPDGVDFIGTREHPSTVFSDDRIRIVLAHFRWRKDFAAARNFSFDLATGKWRFYLDADDTVENMKQLRNALIELEKTQPLANALSMEYIYSKNVVQPDVVRVMKWDEHWTWKGRIHEMITRRGGRHIARSESVSFRIHHHKDLADGGPSLIRNTEIAQEAYVDPSLDSREKARMAYFLAAGLRLDQNNWDECLSLLDEAISVYRGTGFGAQAMLDKARILMEAGRTQEAIDTAGILAANNPEQPEGLMLLGVLHFRDKQYVRALAFFEEALTRNKNPLSSIDEVWWTKGYCRTVHARVLIEMDRLIEAVEMLDSVPAGLDHHDFVFEEYFTAQSLLNEKVGLEKLKDYVDYLVWNTEPVKALQVLREMAPSTVEHLPEVALRIRDLENQTRHLDSWEAYKKAYSEIPETVYHTAEHSRDDIVRLCRYKELVEYIESLSEEGPPVRWLSVGFQDGIIEQFCLAKNPRLHLTVCDVAPQAVKGLKELEEKFPGRVSSHTIIEDHYDWAGEGIQFDLINMFEVLEHVPSEYRALHKLRSLLSENGELFLSTPIASRWVEMCHTDPKARTPVSWHVRSNSHVSLWKLFRDCGFDGTLKECWDGTFVAKMRRDQFSKANHVAIYVPNTPKPFDAWSAERGFTGGSEEAVIRLSEALAQEGFEVTVYTPIFSDEASNRLRGYNGVLWRDSKEFDPLGDHKNVLFWRCPYIGSNFWFKDAPYKKFAWLHDYEYGATPNDYKQFDGVLCLSEAHERAITKCDKFEGPFIRMGNGIRPEEFPEPDETKRDLHKVIYASSPDRGLHRVLAVWPFVRKAIPDATLDIYYDWSQYKKLQPEAYEETKKLVEALKEDGVTYHGGVSQPELNEAMRRSSVWAYPNSGDIETYCITAVKMQACGVIPVCWAAGALPEVVHDGFVHPLPVEAKEDPDSEPALQDLLNLLVEELSAKPGPGMEQDRYALREHALLAPGFTWKLSAQRLKKHLAGYFGVDTDESQALTNAAE